MYKNIIKRLFDIFIATFAIILLLPVYIVTTLILYILNDKKPFFKQKRAGKNNEVFYLLKFKSMNDKKDKNGLLLKDLDRITPFGRFIRKMSIDELPQIINVLKGEMSIVGPRPLLVEYLPYYSEHHKRRHEVRPGITGLAQVTGRNTLKFSQRFNLDVEYVDSISLLTDLDIILKTILKYFRPSEVVLGRSLSEIDDVGVTKGLSKNYFNESQNKHE